MGKQHFLMLAHPYNEAKHGIGGWFASEKLDGQRAVYIPGTRGMLKRDVPFANTDKDERLIEEQVCSGLWSRYGNVIHAPDYWLDDLPNTFLDGELYLFRGTGGRQELSKVIRKIKPSDEDWADVKFHAFDMPSPEMLFATRDVKLPNYAKSFNGCLTWWEGLDVSLAYRPKPSTAFQSTYILLQRLCAESEFCIAHKQTRLSFSTFTAKAELEGIMEAVEDLGGEGVIVRHPDMVYETERTHKLLKVKALNDSEATVIGYVTGRETDKGSKLLGLMGALVVDWNGVRFEMSGFTEAERELTGFAHKQHSLEIVTTTARQWAEANPATECPDWIEAAEFPRGSVVSFRYRDKTTNGAPNEARYWRKREAE